MNTTDICKMSILYITPDQRYIDAIGKFLYTRYQQHRLLFASDSIDALVQLLNSKPDICIIDMDIPPINFSVVISELSKQNKVDQTIFIDSYTNKALTNYDFRHFLSNPLDIDKLCMMIDNIAEEIFFERIESLRG